MTWHNMMEISWHTIMEIEWHSIQEIRWHNMMEIRHDGEARDIQSKIAHIDPRDSFSLIATFGKTTLGPISMEPINI
jgi:hypothetical protein